MHILFINMVKDHLCSVALVSDIYIYSLNKLCSILKIMLCRAKFVLLPVARAGFGLLGGSDRAAVCALGSRCLFRINVEIVVRNYQLRVEEKNKVSPIYLLRSDWGLEKNMKTCL